VVPVVLFHAGLKQFGGGFVGVDVFFVISGYLITTIILSEMESGQFSLVRFYDRRARRILPALFLVMLACIPFAWIWLLPQDLKEFSESLVAVGTFTSNILFWLQTGYWGAANELKPLLHTWSLAVEEQYYVLFPLFLMLMWRFGKRWIFSAFLLTALLSFCMAEWGAFTHPAATFFLLPTRAWELAIGASIAYYLLYRPRAASVLSSHQPVNEFLGMLGLLLIAVAVHWFDETTPFPSRYALVPTVGTSLIILFASPQTVVGRLLGTRLLVGIGLVSYSAYLWHQPILAFARQRSLSELNEYVLAILALLAFPIAYFSWRYAESPFRNKDRINQKAVFSFAVAGSVFFVAIGLIGYLTNGFDNRLTSTDLSSASLQARIRVNHGLNDRCEEEFTLAAECRTSDQPEILLWGDSFAMQLASGILASKRDAKIIQMTKSVCGPFFDVAPIIPNTYPAIWASGCLAFSESVRAWLKAGTTIRYAVVSSPFSQYLSQDNLLMLRGGKIVSPSRELVINEFEKTLSELRGMGIEPIVETQRRQMVRTWEGALRVQHGFLET